MLEGDIAADYVGIWMRGGGLNAAKLKQHALRGRLLLVRVVPTLAGLPRRTRRRFWAERRRRTRTSRIARAPDRPARIG